MITNEKLIEYFFNKSYKERLDEELKNCKYNSQSKKLSSLKKDAWLGIYRDIANTFDLKMSSAMLQSEIIDYIESYMESTLSNIFFKEYFN